MNSDEPLPAVIFAGGRGTRLGDTFGNIPKALVRINGLPIIQRLIDHLNSYGVNEFYVLGGYKVENIRDYFADLIKTDRVTFDFSEGEVRFFGKKKNYRVHVIDTGLDSSTQSRLFQVKNQLLKYRHILVTYADGISDLNVQNVFSEHLEKRGKMTITAVNPSSKFGDLEVRGERVIEFREKSSMSDTWINAGFMIMNANALAEIEDSKLMFEEDYLPKVAKEGQLLLHKHSGFWKAMDTPKDHLELEEYFRLNHG